MLLGRRPRACLGSSLVTILLTSPLTRGRYQCTTATITVPEYQTLLLLLLASPKFLSS